MTRDVLDDILARQKKGLIEITYHPDFDAMNPPDEHTGVNICYSCGEIYWATLDRDAYDLEMETYPGRVCDDCLIDVVVAIVEVDLVEYKN